MSSQQITVDFLRHGQSTFNAGRPDVDAPLTETGKSQAASVSGEWDLVIVSSLTRAKQTLEFSGIKYRNMIVTELCREYQNGSVCDYKQGEDTKLETKNELQSRIETFKTMLRSFAPTYPRILVISHVCFICYLIGTNKGIYNCQFVSHTF